MASTDEESDESSEKYLGVYKFSSNNEFKSLRKFGKSGKTNAATQE